MNKLDEAKRVFDIEIEALQKFRNSIGNEFNEILELVTSCENKVIITGIGKPGHIAKKIAATFSSLGTPAFFLHPAEALHGDLGMVSDKDIVIAISFSGESEELINILPNIRMIGAKLIGITGNGESTLSKLCDVVQILPKFKEACYLSLAPTSSTTAALVYGDALAVAASRVYGFSKEDFGRFHPAGALGKKLILKIDDIMAKDEENPVVNVKASLINAIVEMSKKGLGMVSIIDTAGRLQGILTDGDIRRLVEKQIDVYAESVGKWMTKTPHSINLGTMAVDSLKLIKQHNINGVPIVDGNLRVVGAVTIQMLVKSGIVY